MGIRSRPGARSLALAALLAISPIPAATAPNSPGAVRSTPGFVAGPLGWYSSNWAGYIVSGGTYTSVAGQWTVPRVYPMTHNASSGLWIGIDGVHDGHLIQVGTEQDFRDGAPRYFAWWEILPAPAVLITSFAVRPGDRIQASITKVGTGRWRITIRDAAGGSFSTIRSYTGRGGSAEWIEESPFVGGSIAPLARVGTATFDHALVNGANPRLTATEGGVLLRGSLRLATPSVPDADRDGFNVRRGAVAPSPPPS